MTKGADIKRTFEQLKNSRRILETEFWRDAYEYTKPHRGMGFISGSFAYLQSPSTSKRYQSKILDSTAIESVGTLASSMISGLTPASSQWFNLTLPNVAVGAIPKELEEWMDNSAKSMYQWIHSSNYNAEAFEFFQDIAICGMGGLYVTKAPGGEYNFETWSLDGMFCRDTMGGGKIDTVYRVVPMTVSQMVGKFGKENLSKKLQDKYKKKPSCDTLHPVIHCIAPRMKNGKQIFGKMSKTLPWMSVYVEHEGSHVISESGYHEFPVIIPRWSLIPGTDYSVGVLNDCIADVKTINTVREMMLTNAEFAISGSWIAKRDGVMNPNSTIIRPGQLNFAADVNNIKQLGSPGDFRIGYEEIAQLRAQIRRVLMSDDLEPIDKKNPSATEVQVRAQLIRQILGPVYSRLQSEFLEPLINRCFKLAYRDGSIPNLPEEYGGLEFMPEYISPMARAQRQEDITAMDRLEERMAGLVQIFPEVLDLYDADKATRLRASLSGVPAALMRDEPTVQGLREDQAKAQQAQQEKAEQMQMAELQAKGGG